MITSYVPVDRICVILSKFNLASVSLRWSDPIWLEMLNSTQVDLCGSTPMSTGCRGSSEHSKAWFWTGSSILR